MATELHELNLVSSSKLKHVRDLVTLPDQVHEGDFVLKLTEGLQHADETARTYVAADALVDAFNQS